jgi:hypothetical protein
VSRAQGLGTTTLKGSPEGLTAEQKDCTENPHWVLLRQRHGVSCPVGVVRADG